MYDAIKNFNTQFAYNPEIENVEKFERFGKFIIAGMGGSNLAADLLKIRDPYIDIVVHRNYGLPKLLAAELKERLLIASSYSGNTEETIDSLRQALKEGYSAAVVATGGKLIELAKEYELPYIQLPAIGIQPRSALGFNIKAVLKLMSRGDLMKEIEELADLLNPSDYENIGKELAEKLKGYIPVIYASERNFGLARNWKIKFNETGKIPAYFNVLPELNHNEMTGFDEARTDAKSKYGPEPTVIEERRKLNSPFHFIFLKDADDHPKIQKRMDITEKLYRDRGLKTEILELLGNGVFYKIFSSLILADWTAYYTAEGYGLEAEKVPIVEEFKKLIN